MSTFFPHIQGKISLIFRLSAEILQYGFALNNSDIYATVVNQWHKILLQRKLYDTLSRNARVASPIRAVFFDISDESMLRNADVKIRVVLYIAQNIALRNC